jgi:hypothetical protein
MNPSSVRDTFGSARRKDVPLFQFLATMVVYALLYLALTHIAEVGSLYDVLVRPLVSLVLYPFKH